MQKITISDVAKQAGVSISTVSRVLNKNSTVDETLKRKVQKTIEEMGYVPNANARSIRAGNSNLLSVIIPTTEIAIFASVLQGVMDTAEANGLRVNVYSSKGDKRRDLQCLRDACACSSSGIIYCPISESDREYLETVLAKDIPVVIVMRRGVMPGIPHIYMDDFGGEYKATRYLIQQGHRRIAFFAGFWEKPAQDVEGMLAMMETEQRGAYSTLERLAGYKKALAESGLEFDTGLIQLTRFDYKSGYDAMKEFLSSLVNFDAVLCGNDLVATGVLQALKEQKIAVPERVSLIGYDDSDLARISNPGLTSVRQFPYTIGANAVKALMDMEQGKNVENQKLEAVFTIRTSTAMKAVYTGGGSYL